MKKVKPQRRIKDKIELTEEEIKFCTECGDALEDFSVSEQADDYQAVKKNFEECKKTGKFKGDMCSKMYMITPPDESDI